jgi:hypothetical protein
MGSFSDLIIQGPVFAVHLQARNSALRRRIVLAFRAHHCRNLKRRTAAQEILWDRARYGSGSRYPEDRRYRDRPSAGHKSRPVPAVSPCSRSHRSQTAVLLWSDAAASCPRRLFLDRTSHPQVASLGSSVIGRKVAQVLFLRWGKCRPEKCTLPHDYAVPTREYQLDQSSPIPATAAAEPVREKTNTKNYPNDSQMLTGAHHIN